MNLGALPLCPRIRLLTSNAYPFSQRHARTSYGADGGSSNAGGGWEPDNSYTMASDSLSGDVSAAGGKLRACLACGMAALFVAAVMIAVQVPIFDRTIVPLDEGQLLAIAYRIRNGELLYRDIYTGIFPGVYYATALLVWLAGADLLVTRWAAVFLNVAVALLLWSLASRLVRPFWALLPPLLFAILVVIGFPALTILSYSVLSLLFALIAVLSFVRYLEAGRTRDAVLTGLALTACALTKQNYGVYTAMGIVVGFVWARPGSRLADRGIARALAPVALAGSAATLAAFGALVVAGGWNAFLDATVFSLFASQLTAFNQPIPPIFGPHPEHDGRFMFLYTPPILFNYIMHGEQVLGHWVTGTIRSASVRLGYGLTLATLAIAPLTLLLRTGSDRPATHRSARVVCAFAAIFFLGIFPSAIWSHLTVVVVPVLLLCAWLADGIDRGLAGLARAASLAWRGVFLVALAAAAYVIVRIEADVRRWYPEPMGVPAVSLRVSPTQAALFNGAYEFLIACADPGEAIFVAPDMPVLYVATGGRNPTPYDLTIPGNVKDDVIVERLQASRARCIVYNPRMYAQFSDFRAIFPRFTSYLETVYTRAATISAGDETWHGLERKPEPVP